MPKVLIIISTGFEEIEAVSIIDILRRADIEVVVATINDLLTVGANQITIQAQEVLKNVDISLFDMIVLPGGAQNTQNLSSSEEVKKALQKMKKDDRFIAAICAAPYALYTAGVLNENYTCYPSFEQKINTSSYDAKSEVVIDKKVITSQGPATAMKFSLELVRVLTNEQTYTNVKNGLLVKD